MNKYELHQAHLLLLDMEEDVEMKDIPDWEGLYAITRDGRVWSYRRKLFMKPFDNGHGYLAVKLYKNGKQKNALINRLVALTWVPIPEELQGQRLDVAHLDSNKLNNHYTNLAWQTRAQNLDTDSFREKTRIREYSKIKCIETGEIFPSQAAAARWAGVHQYSVNRVIKGEVKTAGGYHFERYYDEN